MRRMTATETMRKIAHADHIAEKSSAAIRQKYMIGAEKHGGNIKKKRMIPHAIEEANDLTVYLYTEEERQATMVELINHTNYNSPTDCKQTLESLYNMLTIGSPEGIEEEELEK